MQSELSLRDADPSGDTFNMRFPKESTYRRKRDEPAIPRFSLSYTYIIPMSENEKLYKISKKVFEKYASDVIIDYL